MIYNNKVAIEMLKNERGYPVTFGPDRNYPELKGVMHSILPVGNNSIFPLVRQLLIELGLDAKNYNKSEWNPLGDIVCENANILLKPNWVLHDAVNGTESLVTHQSIIHAILPYVFLTKPKKITIGDAPLQYCNFESLQRNYDFGFYEVNYGGWFEVKDFRRTITNITDNVWKISEQCRPLDDYCEVDLGVHSLLEPISDDWRKFRVTVYDPRLMWKHHYPHCHKYLVAKDILDADLVINLPKLKTHQKAGVTCCLKNLIGINGNKEYLPHHRKGGSGKGGDAFKGSSWLLSFMEKVWDVANKHRNNRIVFNQLMRVAFKIKALDEKLGGDGRAEGSWYGNDTIWRTCLDLNRLLLYCDSDGELRSAPVRKIFNLVDAVVAGQGDGPLNPEPLNMHMLLAGMNSAAVDWVAASMFGFNPQKIPTVNGAFMPFDLPLAAFPPEGIELISGLCSQNMDLFIGLNRVSAKPSDGWRGHIESHSF